MRPWREESEPRKPLYSRPVTRRRGLRFQSRIVLLTLAGGLPALLSAVLLLRDAPIADSVQRLIVVVLIGAWVGFAIAVHKATVEPMRSIANLLEALRGGDYAIRGRHGAQGRCARRHRARIEPPRCDAARAAVRGRGSVRAPQQSAGGDRRRGARLRRRRSASASRTARRARCSAHPACAGGAVGDRPRVGRPARGAAGLERVAHVSRAARAAGR